MRRDPKHWPHFHETYPQRLHQPLAIILLYCPLSCKQARKPYTPQWFRQNQIQTSQKQCSNLHPLSAIDSKSKTPVEVNNPMTAADDSNAIPKIRSKRSSLYRESAASNFQLLVSPSALMSSIRTRRRGCRRVSKEIFQVRTGRSALRWHR